jgi:hypothetical protein
MDFVPSFYIKMVWIFAMTIRKKLKNMDHFECDNGRMNPNDPLRTSSPKLLPLVRMARKGKSRQRMDGHLDWQFDSTKLVPKREGETEGANGCGHGPFMYE